MQISRYTPVPFLLMALAAVTAGVVIPMALEKQLIRKSRIARKLVLGRTDIFPLRLRRIALRAAQGFC